MIGLILEMFLALLASLGTAIFLLLTLFLLWSLLLGHVDDAAIAFAIALFDGLLLYLYIEVGVRNI